MWHTQVCVWNYASLDARLMARYLFGIFDVDGTSSLSTAECDALLRMVYHPEPSDGALARVVGALDGRLAITLEEFVELVASDGSVVQPAFDVQARLIERTTGGGGGADPWALYRERRRERFGDAVIPDISYDVGGRETIRSPSRLEATTDGAGSSEELGDDFLSDLFRRVERHLNAPDGFDARLEEERYVDKLRDELRAVEGSLSTERFGVEQVEEVKGLRRKLWSLVDEIRAAQEDCLYAELERDLDIWYRAEEEGGRGGDADDASRGRLLGYESVDAIHQAYDELADSFHDHWDKFVNSYEERFGPVTTHWEKLYDPDQNLSFYFQWQSGERCYDQQLGRAPPAICEVCDHLICITDYKCFNCDAPRSERNRKKYRGRVSIDSLALGGME